MSHPIWCALNFFFFFSATDPDFNLSFLELSIKKSQFLTQVNTFSSLDNKYFKKLNLVNQPFQAILTENRRRKTMIKQKVFLSFHATISN